MQDGFTASVVELKATFIFGLILIRMPFLLVLCVFFLSKVFFLFPLTNGLLNFWHRQNKGATYPVSELELKFKLSGGAVALIFFAVKR